MKNILIPTDFSACAQYAIDAGADLARKFNAIAHIFHNVELPTQLAQLPQEEQERSKDVLHLMSNADILLENAFNQYEGVYAYPIVRTGNFISNLQSIVKEKAIDMIVMGSYGASGKNEFFIGSNAQKTVRVVHCPVLVLKEAMTKVDFDKIVYASNFNLDERSSIIKAKNFIKRFLPREIHLLTVHTSGFFGSPYVVEKQALEESAELFKPFKVHTHIYPDFTVGGGIQTFVSKLKPDLLVISNHNRRPLKRMLVGSNVEALINHIDTPVLSIDYELEPIEESI